ILCADQLDAVGTRQPTSGGLAHHSGELVKMILVGVLVHAEQPGHREPVSTQPVTRDSDPVLPFPRWGRKRPGTAPHPDDLAGLLPATQVEPGASKTTALLGELRRVHPIALRWPNDPAQPPRGLGEL